MKTYIKKSVAAMGLAAVMYGTLVTIAAISAWEFSSVPGAMLAVLGGAVGLMLGDAWEW